MPRFGRVGDRRTHAALRRSRFRGRSGPVGVVWLGDDAVPPRLAFALPRRLGTAVFRNRLRRRARAAFVAVAPPSGTYLVTVQPPAAEVPFSQLTGHVDSALSAARAGSGAVVAP